MTSLAAFGSILLRKTVSLTADIFIATANFLSGSPDYVYEMIMTVLDEDTTSGQDLKKQIARLETVKSMDLATDNTVEPFEADVRRTTTSTAQPKKPLPQEFLHFPNPNDRRIIDGAVNRTLIIQSIPSETLNMVGSLLKCDKITEMKKYLQELQKIIQVLEKDLEKKQALLVL